MNWYYEKAGQRQGPVPDAELDRLIASGEINAATLVWSEGMANWTALAQARPASAGRAAGKRGVIFPKSGKDRAVNLAPAVRTHRAAAARERAGIEREIALRADESRVRGGGNGHAFWVLLAGAVHLHCGHSRRGAGN